MNDLVFDAVCQNTRRIQFVCYKYQFNRVNGFLINIIYFLKELTNVICNISLDGSVLSFSD